MNTLNQNEAKLTIIACPSLPKCTKMNAVNQNGPKGSKIASAHISKSTNSAMIASTKLSKSYKYKI